MIILRFIAVLALLAYGHTISAASTTADTRYLLIMAKPKRVEPSDRLAAQERADEIVLGAEFRVELDSVRVIQGVGRIQSQINIIMKAINSSKIRIGKDIYFLLEVKDKNKYSVVYWGIPETVACLPENLVAMTDISSDLNTYTRYDGNRCVSTVIHR